MENDSTGIILFFVILIGYFVVKFIKHEDDTKILRTKQCPCCGDTNLIYGVTKQHSSGGDVYADFDILCTDCETNHQVTLETTSISLVGFVHYCNQNYYNLRMVRKEGESCSCRYARWYKGNTPIGDYGALDRC